MKHLRIVLRVNLLTLVALLGLLVVLGVEVAGRSQQLEADRIDLLGVAVDNAMSTLSHYEQEARSGRMSEAQAQHDAAEAVRMMRYRGSEYLWINDLSARMVMHPFRPDLEGKDASTAKDPYGVSPFAEAARVGRELGRGMISYHWPRPGAKAEGGVGLVAVEKLSLAQVFKPWGWVIGTGIYVDDMRAAQRTLIWEGLGAAVAASLLVGALAWWIGRGITLPMARAVGATQLMSTGELGMAVRDCDRRDEFGVLARALEAFRTDGLEKRRLEAEAREQEAQRARSQAAMERHTQDFGASVSGVMATLSETAQSMRGVSNEMVEAAQRTRDGAAITSEGAQRAANDLTSIASATEQLTASSGEISRQVLQSAQASQLAAASAQETDKRVAGLSEAVTRVDEVVRLIAGIAAQTNLLALNATIEAARAGEAGKGFAVVASEVKALAAQTASATDQIGAQVGAIQLATQEAVSGIARVCGAIDQVSAVAAAVAAAVEQQGAATREIARSVQGVALVIDSTTTEMSKVSLAADAAGRSSDSVQVVARGIGGVCGDLQQEVTQFLASMREDMGSRRLYERIGGHSRTATLRPAGGEPVAAELKDLSLGGAAFLSQLRLSPGTEIGIQLSSSAPEVGARVVRCTDGLVAVVFRQTQQTHSVVQNFIASLPGADASGAGQARRHLAA